jgi:hypothetical protein
VKIIKLEGITQKPKNYTGIVLLPDGTKFWFKNGEFHREDGPAIEFPDGFQYWCQDGLSRKKNGPKLWFKNNKLHRLNGPAVENADGTKECWIDGKRIKDD